MIQPRACIANFLLAKLVSAIHNHPSTPNSILEPLKSRARPSQVIFKLRSNSQGEAKHSSQTLMFRAKSFNLLIALIAGEIFLVILSMCFPCKSFIDMYTKNFEVVDSFHRIILNVWLIWKSIFFLVWS